MLYYEILAPSRASINRPSLAAGIYADDVYLTDDMAYGSIAFSATRIWCEQDGVVKYIKYRKRVNRDPEVDMKEFAWIKLKAKVL